MVFRAQSHTEISSMSFHPLPSRSRPAAVAVAGICTGGSSTSGARSTFSSRSALWRVGSSGAGRPSTAGPGDAGLACDGDGVVAWYSGRTDGTGDADGAGDGWPGAGDGGGDAGVGGLARGAGSAAVGCRRGWASGVGYPCCCPRCFGSAGGDDASRGGHIVASSGLVSVSVSSAVHGVGAVGRTGDGRGGCRRSSEPGDRRITLDGTAGLCCRPPRGDWRHPLEGTSSVRALF